MVLKVHGPASLLLWADASMNEQVVCQDWVLLETTEIVPYEKNFYLSEDRIIDSFSPLQYDTERDDLRIRGPLSFLRSILKNRCF